MSQTANRPQLESTEWRIEAMNRQNPEQHNQKPQQSRPQAPHTPPKTPQERR